MQWMTKVMTKVWLNLGILLLAACCCAQSVTSGGTLTSGLSLAQSGPGIIPPTLFGLHFRFNNSTAISSWPVTPVITWPGVPFGALRLWDTDTRWQNLNTASGVFSFAALDQYLAAAKIHGVDVLMTLSATPQWAATSAVTTCDYAWFNAVSGFSGKGLGDCSPPADLNADGTGTNQHWRDYLYNLGAHLKGLSASTYAPVSFFELWNEFTRGSGADSCTESSSPSAWLGTCAELARLAVDADCILTGRGASCNPTAMNVAAVGLLPAARMTTANAYPGIPDVTQWGSYLSSGGMPPADVPGVHAYAFQGPGDTYPEQIAVQWSPGAPGYEWDNIQAVLPGTAFGLPIWSTEGSWATSPASVGPGDLPDPDMQEGYIARYYLVGWSTGYRRLYWYAYANSWGRLAYQNGDTEYLTTPPYTASGTCSDGTGHGCLVKAATAYTNIYNMMVGSQMVTPCTPYTPNVVAVWSCGLMNPLGQKELAVWDVAQINVTETGVQFIAAVSGTAKAVLASPNSWTGSAAPLVGSTVTFANSGAGTPPASGNLGPFVISGVTTTTLTGDTLQLADPSAHVTAQSGVTAAIQTTSSYAYPGGYGHYQTLDDYPTLHALSGGAVAIGWKPILLVP